MWEVAAACLVELASCRISLFTNVDARKLYVEQLANGLVTLMATNEKRIFCKPEIHAHFTKTLLRLEINYQVRDLLKISNEFLHSYLKHLYEFTISSLLAGEQKHELLVNCTDLVYAWNRVHTESY